MLYASDTTMSGMLGKVISTLTTDFREAIQGLPNGFYTEWEYADIGNNLTHPVTIGLLISVLQKLSFFNPPLIPSVNTLFSNGGEFQPDISMLGPDLSPWLFIDYESPSSSDARIPLVNIDAYNAFSSATGSRIPYLVITTLPNRSCPQWKVYHRSKGDEIEGINLEEVQRNPFQFWYEYFKTEMSKQNFTNIHFLNISEGQLGIVPFQNQE